MPDESQRFGSDLRLLGDLRRGNDRQPGHDLFVTVRPMTGKRDLATLAGNENLEQALLLRFLTRAGELTVLGHSDYGSRLSELIGELNNDANRNRAKLYVLQALEAESRVKEVLSLEVTPDPRVRTQINIVASLLTIDSNTPLTVAFPFLLGGN
jgi:hypothetical protein